MDNIKMVQSHVSTQQLVYKLQAGIAQDQCLKEEVLLTERQSYYLLKFLLFLFFFPLPQLILACMQM